MSVKILAICQMSVKFQVFCQLSVKMVINTVNN